MIWVGMLAVLALSRPASAQCQDQAEYAVFPGDVLQISAFRKLVAMENYTIRVFDKINIVFPASPQFSSDQRVTPDGRIHLPRGVSVVVEGLNLDQAAKLIKKKFEEENWSPEFYLMYSDFGSTTKDVLDYYAEEGKKGRDVAVGPDGFLHLPFLSDFTVAGNTIQEANAKLNDEYRKHFPQLDFHIALKKADGHRAFIFGQVKQPGAYDVSHKLTAINVLSMAGGALAGADLRNVILLRPDKQVMKGRKLNLEAIMRGSTETPDAILCPGTILYVPKGSMAGAAEFMRNLSDILFFRGFLVGFSWDLSTLFDSK